MNGEYEMKAPQVIDRSIEGLIETGFLFTDKLEEFEKRITELDTRKEWKPDKDTFGG